MQIAFALYEGMTLLDLVGPFQVLADAPGVEAVLVSERTGPVVDHTGRTGLVASHAFDDVMQPDVIVVPGGTRTLELLATKPRIVEWVRTVHPRTTWTTSVCTGSLILGAAGVLDGLDATGHWASLEALRTFGARPTLQRVVFAGKVVTAAGVSAGIDMALALLARMHGATLAQAIQLAIEYDPQPPFDAGSPEKAPAEVVALVRGMFGGGATGA